MSVSREVHLILHRLEETLRGLGARVIIYTEGIYLQYLTVKDFFRRTYVPYTRQEFVEIVAIACVLEQVIIESKTFYQIFTQNRCRPLTELHTTKRIDPIAHRDNHIKVIKRYFTFYLSVPFCLNRCKKRNG